MNAEQTDLLMSFAKVAEMLGWEVKVSITQDYTDITTFGSTAKTYLTGSIVNIELTKKGRSPITIRSKETLLDDILSGTITGLA